MKCSDIPDLPILIHIAKVEESFSLGANWAKLESPPTEWQWRSVRNAMPEAPDKVILAKMRVLMRNGLVQGCCCGCRGDFTLTSKGRDLLAGVTDSSPKRK